MKQLLLAKRSPSIQLGHLYEHLFSMAANQLFYDKRLFLHADYSLTSRTADSGIILIDFESYTDSASALASRLPSLQPSFDDISISIAFTQLLAEEERPFGHSGIDAVKQALEGLHAQPWQYIDELEWIDDKSIRRRSRPLYIAKGDVLKARKLTVDFLLDPDFAESHRELLPLFRQLSWLILINSRRVLSTRQGYYAFDDIFIATRQKVAYSAILKVAHWHDDDVDLKRDLSTCLEVIEDLRRHGGFTRYVTELAGTSYANQPDLAPRLIDIYNDTLILIGVKGWQKLATQNNCDLLLKHMEIELKFGRKRQSTPLTT